MRYFGIELFQFLSISINNYLTLLLKHYLNLHIYLNFLVNVEYFLFESSSFIYLFLLFIKIVRIPH